MINKNLNIKLIENPYKIWIIDNFLKQNIVEDINDNWVSQDTGLWGSSYSELDGNKNILEYWKR